MLEWKAYTDRIILAKILTRPMKHTEVSKHGQKTSSTTVLLHSLNRCDIGILIGDFNAQLGSDNSGLEPTMTNFSRVFASMIIFHNTRIQKVMRVLPKNATENQIDLIASVLYVVNPFWTCETTSC